jgi:hypothetical protein
MIREKVNPFTDLYRAYTEAVTNDDTLSGKNIEIFNSYRPPINQGDKGIKDRYKKPHIVYQIASSNSENYVGCTPPRVVPIYYIGLRVGLWVQGTTGAAQPLHDILGDLLGVIACKNFVLKSAFHSHTFRGGSFTEAQDDIFTGFVIDYEVITHED